MINISWLLSFFLIITSFCFSQNQSKKLDGVVAIVGDEVIFFSELQENIMQFKSQTGINSTDSELKKIFSNLYA